MGRGTEACHLAEEPDGHTFTRRQNAIRGSVQSTARLVCHLHMGLPCFGTQCQWVEVGCPCTQGMLAWFQCQHKGPPGILAWPGQHDCQAKCLFWDTSTTQGGGKNYAGSRQQAG